MARVMRAAALLALGLSLAAPPARAELYKCQGPDGKTLFTSDRSQCPGAAPHAPSGSVQRSKANAPARRQAPARAAAAVDGDEVEAQTWRAKRAEAESALRDAEARIATLHEVAGWCNRGHEIWAENEDGLRRGIDCDDVEAQERATRREKKRLEAYLAEGLEDECRRAGCLPGWIR